VAHPPRASLATVSSGTPSSAKSSSSEGSSKGNAKQSPSTKETKNTLEKASLENPYLSLPAHSSILQSRLEDHYYKTLMEDLMILSYDHDAPLASLESLEKHPEWIRPVPENLLESLYAMPLEKLPTSPFADIPTTSLLTSEHAKIGEKGKSRNYRKRLYNPIDYTIVRNEEWGREDAVKVIEPFSPLPSRVPMPKKIILKIWANEAVKNK
jgi:hypothetical protein